MSLPEYSNEIVSVIIPIYNAEKYVAKTIESALNQTYKEIEIVLVDDCSTDKSAEIISGYVKQNNKVIYHLQEKNMGAAVARNTALDIAQGRYVAFLDSDDLWNPEKIEKQITLMHEREANFCYTAIEFMNEKEQSIKGKRKVKETISYNFLLHNTMIATSSVVIDRKQIGDFQMPLRRSGQDYATWLMLLRNGNVAYGIDEALVKYRISSNSLSSNKFKSVKQVWEIQTQNEGINYFVAAFNVFCFAINAFKKYFI